MLIRLTAEYFPGDEVGITKKYEITEGLGDVRDVWVLLFGEIPATIHFTADDALDQIQRLTDDAGVDMTFATIQKSQLLPLSSIINILINTGKAKEVKDGEQSS